MVIGPTRVHAQLPNLHFEKVGFDRPEPFKDGDMILFGAVIVNQGEGEAYDFVVEVYLDDQLCESGSISLGAFESATLWCNNPWMATEGTHILTWVADEANMVEESNENDNQMSRTFTVGPRADYKLRGDVLDIYDHDFVIKIREIMEDPEHRLKVEDTTTVAVYDQGRIIGDVKVGSYVEVYAEYEYGVHRSHHYIKLIDVDVNLLSATTDGKENVGGLTFDGTDYNLPARVTVTVNREYSVAANPPSGYRFDHWEIGGGVTGIRDSYAQSTWVYVEDPGYVKAWFNPTGKPDIDISITPEKTSFEVGEVAEVIITLRNTGNAEAKSIDCSISLVFLNLEAGSAAWQYYSLGPGVSDSYSILVRGGAEGSGSVYVRVAYYDAQGNQYEKSASVTMEVTLPPPPPKPEVIPAAAAVVASTSATLLAGQAMAKAAAGGKSWLDDLRSWWDRLLRLRERAERAPLSEIEKGADIKRRIRRREEAFPLAVAIIVVGSLLSFSHAPVKVEPISWIFLYVKALEAFPTMEYILRTPDFLVQAITSASIVLVISYLVRLFVAKYLRAMLEYKLWILGILMLIASTVLFKAPYGAPAQVRMPKNTSDDAKARLSLSVILVVIATSGILYLSRDLFPALANLSEMGVYYGLALAASSSTPHKPLAGYMIYEYNRMLSYGFSIICFVLLFQYLGDPIFGVILAVANIGITELTRWRRRSKGKPTIVEVSSSPKIVQIVPTPTTKFCISCGSEISTEAVFCPKCGISQF